MGETNGSVNHQILPSMEQLDNDFFDFLTCVEPARNPGLKLQMIDCEVIKLLSDSFLICFEWKNIKETQNKLYANGVVLGSRQTIPRSPIYTGYCELKWRFPLESASLCHFPLPFAALGAPYAALPAPVPLSYM
jgi:hypothetical protein